MGFLVWNGMIGLKWNYGMVKFEMLQINITIKIFYDKCYIIRV